MTSPRRILVVALDNLGDLVFASALTTPLHDAFPDASIDVWCKQYTAPIAALMPHVRDVIAADPFWAVRPGHPRPALRPFLRSIADVRARNYDLAVVSEAPWRTAAAVASARVPRRVGLKRHRNAIFLTDALPAEDPTQPVVREQARVLAAIGVSSLDFRYRLDATRLGPVRGDLAQRVPSRFVAMHPFAAVPEKRGPLREWLRVADQLRRDDRPLLWVGTPNDLAELNGRRANADEFFVDALGGADLTITAAALSLASLYLGHDSGPLHIANAFGVPVVDVFATGNPVRYGPQGTGPARVLFYANGAAMRADDILAQVADLESAVAA